MEIPRYWALGRAEVAAAGRRGPRTVACWRWSDSSAAAAERAAAEAAAALASRIRSGEPFPERYLYGDRRPLREALLETVATDGGRATAAVTRNAYGARILNTERVAFVDVDFEVVEPPRRTGWMLFAVMFGASAPRPKPGSGSDPVAPLKRWVAVEPERGARVYRTAAGFRFLLTRPRFDPAGSASDRMLAELGSDPLYRRLCRAQSCYRARLTPKPWRCGLRPPASRFPFVDERDRRRFDRWLADYEARSAGYSTCRLVTALGSAAADPETERIVELHDRTTRADSNLPLA